MSTQEIVDRIKAEVIPGMPRSEVEQKLAELPVDYVYVTREELEMIGQTTRDGVPLSGRFDIHTPYEQGFLSLRRAHVFVLLDDQERVVDIRVEGIWTGLF